MKRIISYTRNKYKEINIIILKKLYNNKYNFYLRILVNINSYKFIAISDFVDMENFRVENTT